MLRVTPRTNTASAKSYFTAADYYLADEQELPGQWRGEGARMLGLSGMVRQKEWDALCDNKHPETNARLTSRQRSDRIVGYDFNFHVPKSVSLLYAKSRDQRILEAFRDSVRETMKDVEADAQARVRKGGKNENRHTRNLVWGEFVHFTARPINGLPDPHLHAHCFVQNLTFDKDESKWKAGQFRELKRDAPYYEALFHSRLAHRLGDLGLPIERSKNGWELAGVGRGLVQKFSRRTKQIEDKAREMGVENPDAKSRLGATTREHKQANLSFSQLQGEWRSRMTPEEVRVLDGLEKRIGGTAEPADNSAAARGIAFATGHLFERRSVVRERELLTAALKHSVGKATAKDVLTAYGKSDLLHGSRKGERLVTTREVLAEEMKLVDFARRGRGKCTPFVKRLQTFNRDWLNDAQKDAVRHVVQSRDRVMMIRGAAGVGKTTLLEEVRDVVEANGTRIRAFAPSTTASRVALRDAGFKDADTLASLLVNPKIQAGVKGQLLLIDEAGMVSSRTMREVFDLADRLDCRVLLVGDRYQHASVERGATLRLLEEEAGIAPASVTTIMRQQGEYKDAVNALAEGRTAKGFKKLDELGWIKEAPAEERYRQMAADYVRTLEAGQDALVISPTHHEGERITSEIRALLKEKKLLSRKELAVSVLKDTNLTEAERMDAAAYLPGDVLVFHQNAKGFRRGQRMKAGEGDRLPLDQAKRYQVFHESSIALSSGDLVRITRNGTTADGKHRLNNGAVYKVKGFDREGRITLENGWTLAKDFGFLDYGHVVTSHASQGRTIDGTVFIGQSSDSFPASSREQFYVSVSRAKRGVVVYTDDKKALLDAVSQSDERLLATEFVNGRTSPPLAAWPDRSEAPMVQPNREREDMSYAR